MIILANDLITKEWAQMFRILLSIYLAWLVLLSPRKPIFNDTITIRILFIILLFLFSSTDIISGLLLLLIYFFSFQPILPMNDSTTLEYFEDMDASEMNSNPNYNSNSNSNSESDPSKTTPPARDISRMMDANLKRAITPSPTKPMNTIINLDLSDNYKRIIKKKSEDLAEARIQAQKVTKAP